MANYNQNVNQLKIAIDNADINTITQLLNNPPQNDGPWPPYDIENTNILQYTLLASVQYRNIEDVNQIIKLLLNIDIDNYDPNRSESSRILARQCNAYNMSSLYYITQNEQIESIDSILQAGFGDDNNGKITFLNSQSLPVYGSETVLMAQSVPRVESTFPGNINIVRRLLDHGANVIIDKDRNPLPLERWRTLNVELSC